MALNKKALRADFFLFIVALIWGATFPLTTAALNEISPYLLVTFRFGFAALFLLIWVFPKLKHTDTKVLFSGMILGCLNAGVYLLQTTGMRHVDADTAAFIASMGVVFVPLISPFLKLNKVKRIEIAGTLICLVGLYVLTGADFKHFTFDELLILLAGFFWAASVCYVQKVTPKIKQLDLLAFYQIVFILPTAAALSTIDYHLGPISPILVITILYTSLLATVAVFLIQVRYQKETTATHAAIIYSLEPVLASFIAIYVNDEALTTRVIYGGGIILASIFMIELIPQINKRILKK
jgi:drug/metabolite transporter (DMT)-like permease